jgi:branched-chain amino acid transport system ATP-binding protein
VNVADDLEIRDVHVGYGDDEVLHGVSLRVPAGERIGLLGPNGAGKTTLLKMVSGLLRPASGSVTFAGESLVGPAPAAIVKRGVVHVPEGRHVFPNLTIEENLRIAGYGRGREVVAEGLERAYAAFPVLSDRRRGQAGYLSGGEQQMLALGRAIVARPRLLLLDEMSLGLAPVLIKGFYAQLPDLFAEGCGMLVVEQNASLALQLCSYVYVLQSGAVVEQGTADELAADPARLRAGYLGAG